MYHRDCTPRANFWPSPATFSRPTEGLRDRAMAEGFLARGILRHGMAVANQFVLVGHQTLESHRTARAEFARTDSQLRARSVAEAISEASRSVVIGNALGKLGRAGFGQLARLWRGYRERIERTGAQYRNAYRARISRGLCQDGGRHCEERGSERLAETVNTREYLASATPSAFSSKLAAKITRRLSLAGGFF